MDAGRHGGAPPRDEDNVRRWPMRRMLRHGVTAGLVLLAMVVVVAVLDGLYDIF